jgi:hypothetical protein
VIPIHLIPSGTGSMDERAFFVKNNSEENTGRKMKKKILKILF